MTEFSYEKKVKLVERIAQIKDKNELINIKTLIKTYNPDICMTKNNNGYFAEFQNLNIITYNEIAKFIDKLDNKKKMMM